MFPDIESQIKIYHRAAKGLSGRLVLSYGKPARFKGEKVPFPSEFFPIGDVDRMIQFALDKAAKGFNVYINPSVMRPGVSEFSRGKTSDIVATLALVTESDRDTGKIAKPIPGIKPTIIVESNPQTRNTHQHYILSCPVPPDEALEDAQLLFRKCGGDTGACEINHVWRLADTWNYPSLTKLARGRNAERQAVRLIGGSRRAISVEALRAALQSMSDASGEAPQEGKRAPATPGPIRRSFGLEPPKYTYLEETGVKEALRTLRQYEGFPWLCEQMESPCNARGEQSDHFVHVIRCLFERGLTGDQVYTLATEFAFGEKWQERAVKMRSDIQMRSQVAKQEARYKANPVPAPKLGERRKDKGLWWKSRNQFSSANS